MAKLKDLKLAETALSKFGAADFTSAKTKYRLSKAVKAWSGELTGLADCTNEMLEALCEPVIDGSGTKTGRYKPSPEYIKAVDELLDTEITPDLPIVELSIDEIPESITASDIAAVDGLFIRFKEEG